MNKICIVTVYNSINSGSFWQARALQLYLKKCGYEVVFLRRSDTASSSHIISKMKTVMKRVVSFQFRDAIRFVKTFQKFSIAQKDFKTLKMNELKKSDIIILGSDTIWNLDTKYFRKNYKKYFGGIFENDNIVSYAASVSNTSLETLQNYPDIPNMLKKINNISVRDNKTFEIIKKITDKKVSIVCDPTMLLSKDDYYNLQENDIENGKYIFLYLFSKPNERLIDQIKKVADKEKLTIISGARNMSFADKNIVNEPVNFLNHIIYAKYVITDTFHGTVFSINLNKNFVSINHNKDKVTDVINRFELQNRLINEEDDLTKALKEGVDYKRVQKLIDEVREESMKFLNNALGS